MSAWSLRSFSGEQPRIAPNLLPPNAAQKALNARLDDGALTAFFTPAHESSFDNYPGNFNSIYRYQNTWLGWNGYVKAAPGPVATDRLYITGDGVPKMRDGTVTYNITVPFPTTKLTGTVSGTATDPNAVVQTRIYVYTYVTGFGEESEPCPASDDIKWSPGQIVTLSGFEDFPANRNITSQRIYRTQTGSSGTDLYFIAERPASTGNFVDTIANDAFGEVLPSRAYNAPPDTLKGIVSMPGGMMAAFSGRDVYFCEPWIPHAWPQAYSLTCDWDIVALSAIGTTLLIMTTGQPYIAVGTSPSAMQMMKIETNLPCINPYSVQDLGYSIAYASHEGLVVANADGSVNIVTRNLFSAHEWKQLSPAIICAGQLSGRYVASYNTLDEKGNALQGTIIIDALGQTPYLIRSDVVARAFYYDISEGALFYLVDTGEIKRFDPQSGLPLQYTWRSRPTTLPGAENFGCILIDAADALTAQQQAGINAVRDAAIAANQTLISTNLHAEINGAVINTYTLAGDGLQLLPNPAAAVAVDIYGDGEKVATVTKAGSMVRLPSGFRARKWEVEVTGTMRVEEIRLAGTVDELRTMAAG